RMHIEARPAHDGRVRAGHPLAAQRGRAKHHHSPATKTVQELPVDHREFAGLDADHSEKLRLELHARARTAEGWPDATFVPRPGRTAPAGAARCRVACKPDGPEVGHGLVHGSHHPGEGAPGW